ncbi:MAG: hypothetical protein KGJ95_10500, partial [Candidatus Omnitrophica bacterium]|nr:hypothetical protein [Candidatus Omnitrophota bacterium]
FTNGVSTAGGLMTLYKAETASVVANDGTFSSSAKSVTVNPGTAAGLNLTAVSGTITAGATDQLTITAQDTYGNTATGYTGDKTITFSGANTIGSHHPTVTDKTGSAVNFGTSETLTFTNGVSTAGGLMTLYKVETASVSATDGTFTSNTVSVTVNPATAASLTLSATSGSITAGATDQLTITAYDTYGNVATGYTGDKTFTFSGANTIGSYHPTVTDKNASAVNFGTSETLTFTNGVSTAGGLMTLYKVETASITGNDGALTSNAVNVTVSPAAAASLGLTTASGTLTAGNTDQLTITAYDAFGNTATGYTGDKTITFSGANTIGSYHPTVTDKSGTAVDFGSAETITFTNGVSSAGGLMTLYKAETASVSATDGAFTSNAAGVAVSPAAAANLTLSTASGTLTAGNTDQLTITAYDTFGNVATGYTGDKTFTFAGANSIGSYHPTVTNKTNSAVNFGTSETLTFTNGVSTAGGLMTLYKVETAAVNATDGTFTSNTVDVTVNPAAAASLSLSAANGTINAGSTDQSTITAYDTYGNVATGYTGDKTFTFTGANSIGSYHPTVTDKTGSAVNFGSSETLTFTNGVSTSGGLMILYKAETTSITANDGTLTSNAASVTVDPLSASSLVLTAAGGALNAGATDQLTITAEDTYGNTATGYTGDKTITFSGANSVGSYYPTVTDKSGTAVNFGTSETITFTNGVSSAGGLMTLYKAETASITANDGTLTSDAAGVIVSPGAAASLNLTAAQNSMTAGNNNQLTITAQDTYGNTATSYTGDKTLTFSGANPSGGGNNPTVTDKNGTAVDFGTSETLTFTDGVSSAGGLMTLYKVENASITANDGTFTSNAAAVTVSTSGATTLSLSANSGSITAGGTDQLTITAKDAFGNTDTTYTGDKTYTFYGAGTIGSDHPTVTDKTGSAVNFGTSETLTFTNGVSTAGGLMTLYKAQNAPVYASDGSFTSNTVTVTVNSGSAVSLTLSAANGSVTAGTTDQLTIKAYDTYGNVATGYTGDKTFTFSGANTIGSYHPTVTDKTNSAVNFGTSETLTFTSGVSTAGGLMTLYKAETASVTGTDGSLTSNAVGVTVSPGAAASLT